MEMHLANAAKVGAEAVRRPTIEIKDLLTEEARTKTDEAQGVITSLAVKYIMGRISETEWDAEIGNFLNTYRYMTDERTVAYKARYIDKTA